MRLFSVKALAKAGLLAGVLLGGASAGLAQQGAPPKQSTTVVTAPVSEIAVTEEGGKAPPVAVDAGAASSTCSASGLSAGVDWTKVPVIEKMPRGGNFYFPPTPTGPGYYSLLDLLTGTYREKAPIFPYPPFAITANSSFNYDFRYLDNPDNTQHDWLDPLKRIHLGDDWLLALGGEFRWRHMHEVDSRFTGKNNDYDLTRSRFDVDICYRDIVRIYAEIIDARATSEDLPPLAIDRNYFNIQNLFADVKTIELLDTPVYLRVGRQELLYGSQRLISPLDWANTRRPPFDGFKGFWHSEKLDVDLFCVRPTVVSATNPAPFDSADDKQTFAGIFTTYRPAKSQSIDVYYLYLDNEHPIFLGQTIGRVTPKAGMNVSTIGARYYGDSHNVMWDFEGMYQFGDYSTNQDISAGSFTAGLGYHFGDLPMNPQIWVYNDWYSGDHNPNATDTHGTFNQLFPFAHYYLGFTDLVGQQNIDDLHLNFCLNPVKWITFTTEYHVYRLDAAKDFLYNSAGVGTLRDPTGKAGTDVGTELDLTANFHLSQHQDIFIGWSKLYAGAFVKATSHNNRSPELAYFMYAFKF
jgi:hypothetical protein